MTEKSLVNQNRIHPEIYLNIVNAAQAKYIALHVGIFWSIGTFIIKNNDNVRVMIDSKAMYNHLVRNIPIQDEFIQKRTRFYNQLIEQRMLNIRYQLIKHEENISSKFLMSE